jgi:hypothetical protein
MAIVEIRPPIVVDEHGDINVYLDIDVLLCKLEPIDVENQEYEFFDSTGLVLRAAVVGSRIMVTASAPAQRDPEVLAARLRDYIARVGPARVGLAMPVDEASLQDLVNAVLAFHRRPWRERRAPGGADPQWTDALRDRQQRFRNRLGDALAPFCDSTVWTQHAGRDDVVLSRPAFALALHADMSRWLGLEFEAWPSGYRARSLLHCIDTDLYPIGRQEQWWFADAIADEIVELLELLASGEIRVGLLRGRPAMVIGGRTIIYRGRLFTTSRAVRPRDFAELADLTPVYEPPKAPSHGS